MSTRPYLNPAQPVEVTPSPKLADSIAIAAGLAVLITGIWLWRLIFWGGNHEESKRRAKDL